MYLFFFRCIYFKHLLNGFWKPFTFTFLTGLLYLTSVSMFLAGFFFLKALSEFPLLLSLSTWVMLHTFCFNNYFCISFIFVGHVFNNCPSSFLVFWISTFLHRFWICSHLAPSAPGSPLVCSRFLTRDPSSRFPGMITKESSVWWVEEWTCRDQDRKQLVLLQALKKFGKLLQKK